MLCPPLRCHVCQVFVADMTEEETSIHQINCLGFSVQLLLQLHCQRLITVLWLQMTVGAEGLGRASWDKIMKRVGTCRYMLRQFHLLGQCSYSKPLNHPALPQPTHTPPQQIGMLNILQ